MPKGQLKQYPGSIPLTHSLVTLCHRATGTSGTAGNTGVAGDTAGGTGIASVPSPVPTRNRSPSHSTVSQSTLARGPGVAREGSVTTNTREEREEFDMLISIVAATPRKLKRVWNM